MVVYTQEMTREQEKLRTGQKTYHDVVFEEEIKNLINITNGHYEKYAHPLHRTPDQNPDPPDIHLARSIRMRSNTASMSYSQPETGIAKSRLMWVVCTGTW